MTIDARLAALRKAMRKNRLSAYLVPGTDPHQSEYLPECWQRREWLSGFTGSAGELLVTSDQAFLWTDGRYFLQAEQELADSEIELMRMGLPDVPAVEQHAASLLGKGKRLGVDPRLLSVGRAGDFEMALGRSRRRALLSRAESGRSHLDRSPGATSRARCGDLDPHCGRERREQAQTGARRDRTSRREDAGVDHLGCDCVAVEHSRARRRLQPSCDRLRRGDAQGDHLVH